MASKNSSPSALKDHSLALKKAKPIVKWAGGKRSVAPLLKSYVPTSIKSYLEPFAGGAALFFELYSKGQLNHLSCTLSDTNQDLICLYTVVRDELPSLLEELAKYTHSEKFYYKLREKNPEKLSPIKRAARMLFLNKTCFNGLWRVNSKGEFNVPFGNMKHARYLDKENLTLASKALSKVHLVCSDYKTQISASTEGDFIYFDPPYLPLSKTALFTSYAREGFDFEDQKALANHMKELSLKGVKAMLSNHDTPETRELYAGMRLIPLEVRRSISRDGGSRLPVKELIVLNWL